MDWYEIILKFWKEHPECAPRSEVRMSAEDALAELLESVWDEAYIEGANSGKGF
jgi:hypothetical protein